MELVKKNFYTEQKKAYTETQMIVEEDQVLDSEYEDMIQIIAGKTRVQLTDQKIEEGKLTIKGVLPVEILYEGVDGKNLYRYKKEIPFEEEIYIENLESKDEVEINCYLEDYTPQIIHSRKISHKALITLKITVEQLKDAKVVTNLEGIEEPVEIRTIHFEAIQLKSNKKDIFRIKQDIPIAATNPNIAQILWDEVHLKTLDWKAAEGKVLIHGEVSVFVLYQAESQNGEISFYETVIPISGNVDVSGCQEKNLIDLEVSTTEYHIDVKEDFDGEKRVLGVELSVHMKLRCMEEGQTEMIADLYGTTKEIHCNKEWISYEKLLFSSSLKKKIAERIPLEKRIDTTEPQMLYSNGSMTVEKYQLVNDELQIQGFLWIQYLLYQVENQKYKIEEKQLPIEMSVQLSGLEMVEKINTEELLVYILVDVEQLLLSISDLENLEVRALLNLHISIRKHCQQEVIDAIEMAPIDQKKISDLPGMVVYFAKEGDSLWEIGKKYYMSVGQIKEQNHVVGDYLHAGDKILLIKSI